MPTPAESKTVLARVLPYAQAIGWTMVSQKGFSARAINQRLGRRGSLWQDEYWDRLIRSDRHFFKVAACIRENPVKAGLEGRYLREPFFLCHFGMKGDRNVPAPFCMGTGMSPLRYVPASQRLLATRHAATPC